MISVEGLSVTLDDTPVLDGISFDVEAGETVGIIGPNGAGKTTLLRTIDGLLEPTRGSVRVLDDRVDSLSSRERARRIAVLAQSSEIRFDFTVRDIVAMGRTPYQGRFGNDDGGATAVVDDALERTDLEALSERSITAVSGGERQRVLIARAIAQETPVLLLDEPTVSLDINHQIATFEQVRSLAAEGKAVVAAIHDLDLAARYCDRLLLLVDGNQLAIGPPDAVLETQLVERAYGTRAAVRHDALTGTTSVTPLPERRARSDVHTHVVGHGGACAPVCRELDAAGFEVSLGIVRHGDPDHMVAEALDLTAISLPPAAPIDEETRKAHRRVVRNSDVIVVAPFHAGPGTRHLLDVVREAGDCFLLDDPPFARRNHDGQQSKRRWERLRANHDVVEREELLERLTSRPPTNPGGNDRVEGTSQSLGRRI